MHRNSFVLPCISSFLVGVFQFTLLFVTQNWLPERKYLQLTLTSWKGIFSDVWISLWKIFSGFWNPMKIFTIKIYKDKYLKIYNEKFLLLYYYFCFWFKINHKTKALLLFTFNCYLRPQSKNLENPISEIHLKKYKSNLNELKAFVFGSLCDCILRLKKT